MGEGFDIDDLSPSNNMVHTWNIMIIGSDRAYISSQINDDPSDEMDSFPQLNATTSSSPLFQAVNGMWDMALLGEVVHKFLLLHDILFVVSVFPLINRKHRVCGAILFMRRCITLLEELKASRSPPL
jgi:hypothetical protein